MRQDVLVDVARRVAKRVHPNNPNEIDVLAYSREDYESLAMVRGVSIAESIEGRGWPELRVENYVARSLWRQGVSYHRTRTRREQFVQTTDGEESLGASNAHEDKNRVEGALEARNAVKYLLPKLSAVEVGLLWEFTDARSARHMFDPQRHSSLPALRRRLSRVRAKARDILTDVEVT